MLTAVFWGCVAISIAVFGVMIYSVATFRRTGRHAAFDRRSISEVVWASIPIVITVMAATPAIRLIGSG